MVHTMPQMAELPAGTVTFVFTDIEGSTALLKELGDRYGEVLSQHRRIVRDAFGARGGREIDTQGDAFFFAFPRAREAVTAAIDVQRGHASAEWPDGATVRVRIGLHTGEPAVGEEGYLGLDVVRAARICTVARGGNVLLSETTRALVGSSLPDGVSVFPLGERHLKGLDEPERVYELEIEGVAAAPAAPAAPEPEPTPEERLPRRKRKSKSDFDRRMDDFGERLERGIQERVLRMLDKTLGKVAVPPGTLPHDEADDEAVEDIAARAASFEERIRARVEESLRAAGVPPEPPR
jgi:class 3 adenylate cyclase